MVGQHFVGLQNIVGCNRIEPGGDSEAVVVLQGGASGPQQFLWGPLGQQGINFRRAGIDQKSVGLQVLVDAVVAALSRGEFLQEFRIDAGALQQCAVGPGRVTIHATKKYALLFVRAGAEVAIENVGVRPELKGQAEDFEDVSAHAAAGLSGNFGKQWEFVERSDLVRGVGGDQAEPSINHMAMRIDEAGEEALAFEIDALGGCGNGLQDVGEVADGDDLVPAKRDGLCVGMLGIGGEDFGVKQNALISVSLR